MRGLPDGWTSEQVGGRVPDSRLGLNAAARKGAQPSNTYGCSFLTPLELFSFFQLPPKLPASVEYRGAGFSCLAEEARASRHASAPHGPRAGLDVIVNSPFLCRKLPSESQNLRWEMHTGILEAVHGTAAYSDEFGTAESNGIKAVNLVAMTLASDTPAPCSPWVQSPGMTLAGCWGCKGPIVRGDVRNDPGCCLCLVAGDRWHACWWPTCCRSSRAFCGPSAAERSHRPACSVSLLPRLASRV